MSKGRINTCFITLAIASVAIAFFSTARNGAVTKPAAAQFKTTIASALSRQPFSFEENRGQTDSQVKFIARTPGATIFISPTEATFRLESVPKKTHVAEGRESFNRPEHQTKAAEPDLPAMAAAVRMRLVGANPRVDIEGLEPLASRTNYFIGSDRAKWHTGVRSYRKVRMKDVYPGIDLIYYGDRGTLEYDLIVAPQADPSRVRFEFEGTDETRFLPNGDVMLTTAAGSIKLRKAAVYQERDGKRSEIDSHYTIGRSEKRGASTVEIKLASYDRALPLVVDPTLAVEFSTYWGGKRTDEFFAVTFDADGNLYLAGQSDSTNYPITAGVVQPANAGNFDAVVTKFNPTGAVVSSTFIGGSGFDSANAILINNNEVFVSGETFSFNFPITNGSQFNLGISTADSDGWVAALPTDLSTLVASGFIGGSSNDQVNGMAFNSLGNLVLVGTTFSNNFPTTSGAVQPIFFNLGKPSSASDAFVTIVNPATFAIVDSTFAGGSGNDSGVGVVVNPDDNTIWLGGDTSSPVFPELDLPLPCNVTTFQNTLSGDQDGFIVRFSGDLSDISGCTYFGGSMTNTSSPFTAFSGIGLNLSGVGLASGGPLIAFAGSSNEKDVPAPAGSTLTSPNAASDKFGFVGEMTDDLTTLKLVTAPEGSGASEVNGLTFDKNGNLIAVGAATSKDYPSVSPLQQPSGGSSWIANTGSPTFTFQTFNNVIDSSDVTAAAFMGSDNIILGASNGLFLAPISGTSFTPLGNLPNNSFVNSIAVDSTGNVYVTYFNPQTSTSDFVWSTNSGNTFSPLPNETEFGPSAFFGIVQVDKTGDPYVNASGKLFREDLGTAQWIQVGPSPMNHVFTFALDPNSASNIVALDSLEGLYVATDLITYNNVQSNSYNFTVATWAADGSLLLANGASPTNGMNPLLRSTDDGTTLNNGALPLGVTVRAIGASPTLVNGGALVDVVAGAQLGNDFVNFFSSSGGTSFIQDPNLALPTQSFSSTSTFNPSVAFSPNGTAVFVGGATNSDGTIQIYDPDGTLISNSTFGGSSNDSFYDVATGIGSVTAADLVAGFSSSSDFPVDAAQPNLNGIENGVVVAIALPGTPTATPTATATATATATPTPSKGRISVSTKPITLKTKAGHPKSKALKVKNVGTGPLDVTGTAGLSAPLSASGSGVVAPKKSLTITVTDSPTKGGSTVKETLEILSDDPTKPEVDISVTGTSP